MTPKRDFSLQLKRQRIPSYSMSTWYLSFAMRDFGSSEFRVSSLPFRISNWASVLSHNAHKIRRNCNAHNSDIKWLCFAVMRKYRLLCNLSNQPAGWKCKHCINPLWKMSIEIMHVMAMSLSGLQSGLANDFAEAQLLKCGCHVAFVAIFFTTAEPTRTLVLE